MKGGGTMFNRKIRGFNDCLLNDGLNMPLSTNFICDPSPRAWVY